MDSAIAQDNWALLVAGVLVTLVILVILARVLRGSARGQLRRTLADLADQQSQLKRSAATAQKAEKTLDRLLQRQASVKPRHIQEAKDALQDARSLEKIASDKVLVAKNQVRRVIHEEFPPARQGRLRQKFLPDDGPDKTPFSF
jgi:septal ring factor EnvC (AmiA/AmiB activator)